jgi:hypothetical protein
MNSNTNGTSSSNGTGNGHGGSRPGAGRKPKALAFADTAALVEEKIAAALPDITDTLIEQAKNGDLGAAKYLCDRLLGRVATVETPPALDTAAPPDEADWEHEQRKRAFERQVKAENLEDDIETRPAKRAQDQNMMRLLSGLGT